MCLQIWNRLTFSSMTNRLPLGISSMTREHSLSSMMTPSNLTTRSWFRLAMMIPSSSSDLLLSLESVVNDVKDRYVMIIMLIPLWDMGLYHKHVWQELCIHWVGWCCQLRKHQPTRQRSADVQPIYRHIPYLRCNLHYIDCCPAAEIMLPYIHYYIIIHLN